MTETRKLAAILVADVVGYSRLAGADEDRTLARLRGDLIGPAIAVHHDRIIRRRGAKPGPRSSNGRPYRRSHPCLQRASAPLGR
jgi:hypothetical protein